MQEQTGVLLTDKELNMARGQLKVLTAQEDKDTPPGNPIRVKKNTDAKRLLSRLIYQLQKGEITGQDAKDLCYLLSTFITLSQSLAGY